MLHRSFMVLRLKPRPAERTDIDLVEARPLAQRVDKNTHDILMIMPNFHDEPVPLAARVKRLFLWRHENPPPGGERYWFIVKIWHYHEDVVRVLVNPLGEGAGLYEVDVRTLRWARL